jgi:hypothetical protein
MSVRHGFIFYSFPGIFSGQSESQEETEQFLNKLKTEAPESVKSNALEEPETL